MNFFDHVDETPSVLSVMQTIEGQGFGLNLSSAELAFLAGIEIFSRQEIGVRLSEGELQNLFLTLDAERSGNVETAESRANSVIRKFIEQRLLCRVCTAVDSDSVYRLTFLGEAIAFDLIRKDTLTKDTLETMLSAVNSTLDEVKNSAETGGDNVYWRNNVLVPLKATVSLLVEAIDRRQHYLDQKQFQAQSTFEKLYSEDGSISGIGKCEELLNNVAKTLRELDQALFQGAGILKDKLSSVEEIADSTGQAETAEISRAIYRNLDEIVDWAKIRGEKWSEYYHSAHEFLRSAVRLDIGRAFARRLRKDISDYMTNPWTLHFTIGERFIYLREEEAVFESGAISRESGDVGIEHIDLDHSVRQVTDQFSARLEEKLKQGEKVDLRQMLDASNESDVNILFQLAVTGIKSIVDNNRHINVDYHPKWQNLLNGGQIQELKVSELKGL